MDRLFVRYADPFSLLNGYIRTARFCDFIHTFSEQKLEDDRWEVYLHKVFDKSYTEFCESLQSIDNVEAMSEDDMETTVRKSMDILNNFNPNPGEGEE